MKKYQFPVVVTKDGKGLYVGYVPSLAGCHTQAKSLPQLYKRLEEVIELCVEVERKKKQEIPQEKFISIQHMEVAV